MSAAHSKPGWSRWAVRHLEALVELGRARVELTVSSWRSVLGESSRAVDEIGAAGDSGRIAAAERIERAVRRVDRFVPGVSCMHRAVAGRRMLDRRGIDARVVIGLKKEADLAGHAWIEVSGPEGSTTLFGGEEDFRPVSGSDLRG